MSQNKPLLPTDANSRTIHIPFRPKQAMAGVPFSTASGAMTSTLPKNAIVRIVATQPCHYKLVSSSGNAAVTDHYMPANEPYDVILHGTEDKIGVVGLSGTAGTLYASIRGGGP